MNKNTQALTPTSSLFFISSVVDTVLLLRTVTLIIKVILLLFVNTALNYNIPWLPITIILAIELAFNTGCYAIRNKPLLSKKANLQIQLMADVILLACLLYFSGGATNAFVSLLLIPIAIAAVTLPSLSLAIITGASIAVYSFLLWLMPMHVMHGNMQGHFIGMWINFIFSAAVVSLVIAQMAKAITLRELKLVKIKEQQIKQEKVMALGIASAQVTHDLATPLATIRLLTDEIAEDCQNQEAINDLNSQVERCCASLHQFREMTLAIKEHKKQFIRCATLYNQIQQHCNLNYPNINIEYANNLKDNDKHTVFSDSSLVPAILNVIDNGIKASKSNNSNNLLIESTLAKKHWLINVRDYGNGFLPEQENDLGNIPIRSDEGFGVAMLLSSSSFTRVGGSLTFNNHPECGANVCISLPITSQGNT